MADSRRIRYIALITLLYRNGVSWLHLLLFTLLLYYYFSHIPLLAFTMLMLFYTAARLHKQDYWEGNIS